MRNNYKVIEIPKLKEYDLSKKIGAIMKKNGYSIDYDSIQYLIRNSLGNYDIIYSELEKLQICFLDTKKINLSDLKNIVSRNIEDNVFKLVNAIIEKNAKAMFSIYEDLKLLKEEPIAIISLLAREYRNMYLIKTNNRNNGELQKLLNIQSWQYEKYQKQSYEYSITELKEKLIQLYNLDLKIKSGKIDKYLGLELFMLN